MGKIPPSHHKPMKFLVRGASEGYLGKLAGFFPRKLSADTDWDSISSPAKSEPISEQSALTSILLHPSFNINKATSFLGTPAPKSLWNQVWLGVGIPRLEDSPFLQISRLSSRLGNVLSNSNSPWKNRLASACTQNTTEILLFQIKCSTWSKLLIDKAKHHKYWSST